MGSPTTCSEASGVTSSRRYARHAAEDGEPKGRGRGTRGRGTMPGQGGRGGRIWRPSAEVSQKFCGVWRYTNRSQDQFEISLNERGALCFSEQDVSGRERASGLLEPGEKKYLQTELTSSEGGRWGTMRIRRIENQGSMQTNFRDYRSSEWSEDRTARNILEPPPAKTSLIELQALIGEVTRLREKTAVHLDLGEMGSAASGFEEAERLLQPHEHMWEGDRKPAANTAGDTIKKLRQLQLDTLLDLAQCYLERRPRAEPGKALECCEKALRLRDRDAKGLLRKGFALAAMERFADAQAALAPASILDPGNENIVEELARLRLLAGDEPLLDRVQELRTEGNEWVKAGRIEWGAHRYEEALALLWGRPWPSDEEREARKQVNVKGQEGSQGLLRLAEVALLTNLALCYLQGSTSPSHSWPPDPAHAICLCRMALDIDPKNVKAMIRKARGHSDLCQYEEAVMQLSYAAELQPQDAAIARELAMAKRFAEDARRKARKWEKEVYRNMFDRIEPGFATPASESSDAAQAGWPADMFPTPVLKLGSEEIASFADQLACTLETDGEGPYTMELLHTIRYAVELEYGQGAAKELARMVPFVHLMTCGGGMKCTFELGKGQRRLTSALEGLPPEGPFHAAADHTWCSALALQAGALLGELRDQANPELWEVPWSGDGAPPRWRSVTLVRQGAWAAGKRFGVARALLRGLPDLRPYEVSFVRLPPQTMLKHSANANVVLTAHLTLQLGEGQGTLCVGEHQRDVHVGDVAVFDPTYVHFLANNSHEDAYVLACHFYHPGVREVERYTLLFLEALIQSLQKTGLFSLASLAPSPGLDVQKALKYAA